MAIIRDNYVKYQVMAFATNQSMTYYSVKAENSDEIEMLSLRELKLLSIVNLPLFDSEMKPIKFNGMEIIGNIPDVTHILYAEDVVEDDDEVSDFFDAYDDDDDVFSGADESTGVVEDGDGSEYDDYADEYDSADDEDYDYSDEGDSDDLDDFYAAYEDDDDEEEEGSTVSKLYTYLTEEQIKVLKRYYLWYSQQLFIEAQHDPTLGMKDMNRLAQKKADLDQLRNTGGLWHYAGFVDMGKKGNGYCTLGHPLRYMHLAWDVSVSDIEQSFFGEDYNKDFEEMIESNNCIIFGIKCISDFFEVDEECRHSLQRAQRESLKDMAMLYEYYANSKVDEVNATFVLMDEVIKHIKVEDAKGKLLKKDYKPIVPYNLTAFYLQFRELSLIPPKSLIQEIRDNIVGWEGNDMRKHKFSGELHYPATPTFHRFLNGFCGKGYEEIIAEFSRAMMMQSWTASFLGWLTHYVYVYFTYEICGQYCYNADTNKDEGGASKRVKELLENCYSDNVINKLHGVDFSKASLVKLLFVAKYWLQFKRYDSTSTFTANFLDKRYEDDMLRSKSLFDTDFDALLKEYDLNNNSNFYDAVLVVRQLAGLSSRSVLRSTQTTTVFVQTAESKLSLEGFYNLTSAVKKVLDDHLEPFKVWIDSKNQEQLVAISEEKARKEAEKLELERQRKEAEEAARIAREEALKSASTIKTPDDVVAFLKTSDLSGLSDEYDLPRKILKTVVDSGKTPSRNQFYHIQRLYEAVTGVEFTGSQVEQDKVKLSDRPELLTALQFMLNHKDLLDKKTADIITSIVRYGTISERQMKYALEAEEVYKKEFCK